MSTPCYFNKYLCIWYQVSKTSPVCRSQTRGRNIHIYKHQTIYRNKSNQTFKNSVTLWPFKTSKELEAVSGPARHALKDISLGYRRSLKPCRSKAGPIAWCAKPGLSHPASCRRELMLYVERRECLYLERRLHISAEE